MNTTVKKIYMIPETETLSLESMYSLMSLSGQDTGNGVNDPGASSTEQGPGGFSAPGRKVF